MLFLDKAERIMATRSRFVIRATTPNGPRDRTFYIDVEGTDDPLWNTSEGYLPVGVFGENYALNNQYVDYQLSATPVESPLGTELKYYIANNDGNLPPGLSLSETGRITGFLKDQLLYDGYISKDGGYDTESYDGYSYDHAGRYAGQTLDDTVTGLPKIYQFKVSVTDGINIVKRVFKILVSSTEILRYNTTSMPVDIVLPNPISSIQPVQWLVSSDLGSIRANNFQDIRVEVYDPAPLVGTLTYTLVEGEDIYSKLPQGLRLDPKVGHIYGYTPYQPAYTHNYTLTINAVKENKTTHELFTATNTFTLALRGEVESYIEWVSDSDLGSIDTGVTSEISVSAQQLKTNYDVKYVQTGGTIPQGLTLQRDGSLSGFVEYGHTGTYTFTVLATDVYELGAIEKEFKLTVTEYNQREYTSIYVKPFLAQAKRDSYREFISNEFTFDPNLMYRYFDPNFGVQNDIKLILHYGIEKVNLDEYATALWENFYRKRLYFGDVKVAVAHNSAGDAVYEIVYVEVVDDMVNNDNLSINRLYYTNNDIFYPGSIDNMRKQLGLIVLPDDNYVDINEYTLPMFMRTPQAGDYKPPGYLRVIPLCYALPGQGSRIVSRIKISGFDFKLLDFEIDRIIVQNSLDNSSAKYLIMERQALGDRIITDDYLYGVDETRLDSSLDNPLIRR